jgi:prevent-host-death family protein
MKRLTVAAFRTTLREVLDRAEFQGERIIILRRGKDCAAVIPIEDLKLFERLLDEAEDRQDTTIARAALAESDERISYEEFRRRRGVGPP